MRCGNRHCALQLLSTLVADVRPNSFLVHDSARKLAQAHLQRKVLTVTHSPRDEEGTFSSLRVPDLATAYAVSAAVADVVGSSGPSMGLAGYKVGATNAAAQARMGLTEPFYGPLYAHNISRAPAAPPGGRGFVHTMERSTLWDLRGAELEYAFEVGGRDVGPRSDGAPWTASSILTHTAFIYPAIELVASRLVGDVPTLCKVADQAVHGHAITSPSTFLTPEAWVRWVGQEAACFTALHACEALLSLDGDVQARGTGGAVLGDPAASLAWLANALLARGSSLKAGQVVITGTMCTPPLVPIPRGGEGRRTVTVAGQFLGFGTVEVHLA